MGKTLNSYHEFDDSDSTYIEWDAEPYATIAERVGKGRKQRRAIRKAWSRAKRNLEKERWQRHASRWHADDEERLR
jgi:hypothetical protein